MSDIWERVEPMGKKELDVRFILEQLGIDPKKADEILRPRLAG